MADTLGWSFAGSNDSIGEALDRWQSSSLQISVARGPRWDGALPDRFGAVLEYRLRSDILTPENLRNPLPDDRRHAGFFALGVHAHQASGPWQMRAGAEIFVIGPETGLLDIQRDLHELLGFPVPTLDDFQIDDSVLPQVSGEIARGWSVAGGTARPFFEAQIGPEDLLRAGVDLTFGGVDRGALLTRLPVTGHRVPLVRSDERGWSWTLGGDVAWVEDSVFLPETLGYDLTFARVRLRAGAHYVHDRADFFYGLSWLSPEFEAQREGQFVGALHLGLRF